MRVQAFLLTLFTTAHAFQALQSPFRLVKRPSAVSSSPITVPRFDSSSVDASSSFLPRKTKTTTTTTTHLSLSSNASADNDETSQIKKLDGRRKRVVIGCRSVSISFLAMTIFTLVKNGIAPHSCYTVAGPFLASGVAFILSEGAANNDQLQSDSFKRMSLFLGQYGLLGLIVATTLVPQLRSNPFWIVWVVTSFLAVVNAIKGYAYGVFGWELDNKKASVVVDDLVKGSIESIKSLLSIPKSLTSTGYLAATLTVGGMKLAKLVELVELVASGAEPNIIASRVIRYSKLALLMAVMFTLKDSTDHNRSEEGNMFIQLNFLSSIVFGSMTAYLCQGGLVLSTIPPLGAAAGFFSIFSAFQGGLRIWKKRNAKEDDDE